MPKPVQMIKVFANPFAAELDHEDRPHGHIQYEPDLVNGDPQLRWVGCHLIATEVQKADRNKQQVAVHDHVWEYDHEPTSLPLTAYYLSALREHGHHGAALLPADAETYALVHGTTKGFREPHHRLHQYVQERKATPRLKPPAGHDPTKPRDHDAEWTAFVAKVPPEAQLEPEAAAAPAAAISPSAPAADTQPLADSEA